MCDSTRRMQTKKVELAATALISVENGAVLVAASDAASIAANVASD